RPANPVDDCEKDLRDAERSSQRPKIDIIIWRSRAERPIRKLLALRNEKRPINLAKPGKVSGDKNQAGHYSPHATDSLRVDAADRDKRAIRSLRGNGRRTGR